MLDMNSKLWCVFLAVVACGGADYSQVPDPGTPCDCGHVDSAWIETDNATGARRVLRVCVDHTPPSTCGLTKGDAGCDGITVLLGPLVCTWDDPTESAAFCPNGCPHDGPGAQH